jgi:hypothetical protein
MALAALAAWALLGVSQAFSYPGQSRWTAAPVGGSSPRGRPPPLRRFTGHSRTQPLRGTEIGWGAVGESARFPGSYWWTESDAHVEVRVLVPEGSAARDVACDLKAASVRMALQGRPLLEGKLRGKVFTDGSYW